MSWSFHVQPTGSGPRSKPFAAKARLPAQGMAQEEKCEDLKRYEPQTGQCPRDQWSFLHSQFPSRGLQTIGVAGNKDSLRCVQLRLKCGDGLVAIEGIALHCVEHYFFRLCRDARV